MSFSITGPSSVTVNVPADYPQVSAASLRSGSIMPGVEFVQSNGSRVIQTLVDAGISLDQDVGAGDFTWWVRFSVPASLTGNAGVAALTPNNTFCIPGSDNAVALVQQNSDIQLVFGNTTNNTRYPLGLSGRTGQIVDVTITRTGGSLSVYIDGALATVAGTNTGTGAFPSVTLNTDFALTGGAHSSGNPNAFAGIVFRHAGFNYALTAARVLDLVRFGVDISDQWGSKSEIISPTILNGGFETAGAGGADVFAVWIEFTSGTSTINRDTTVFASGTASCRFDLDASGSSVTVGSSATMTLGRRYRFSCVARGTGTNPGISINTGNQFFQFVGSSLNNSGWQARALDFVAGDPSIGAVGSNLAFIIGRAIGASSGSIWIDDVRITRLGAIFDLSFSDIYGYQAPDRSDNELDGTLIGEAAFTLPGTKSGHARWTCGANGGTQLLGQRAIPPSAAIRTVFVENIDVAGTPTFSLGTTSGGTQIINAVTIGAAGTTTQITPSAIFSSSGNLWASWSASGDVRVTVLYDRI